MFLSRGSSKWFAGCALLCLGALSMPVMAGTFNVCSDTDFSYTGTVTDPGGTSHAIIPYVSTPGSTTYSGRDASICATDDSSGPYTYMETNWYSTTAGNGYGHANPNNKDSGFVQLVDDPNASVTSAHGSWTVHGGYATFTLTQTGGPTTGADNRLWAAPNITGAASTTGGQFQSYNLRLTATFHAGDVTEESPGWWSTSAVPIAVGGGFSGTFLNTGSNPDWQGLYAFDFSFVDGGWAGANGLYDPDVNSRYFAASTFTDVSEPPTLVLFGLAVFGIILAARRRGRRERAQAAV